MLTPEGDINQDFFKPEKVRPVLCCQSCVFIIAFQHTEGNKRGCMLQIVVLDDRKWGAEERDLLYKACFLTATTLRAV